MLFLALLACVQPLGGTVFYAPLRVRVAPGRFREPDLVLLLDVNDPRNQNAFWLGADLVVEIVSPDHVERDTVLKRTDYAAAGIPEYWIVSRRGEHVQISTTPIVSERRFAMVRVARRGETITLATLPDVAVRVDDLLPPQA